MSVVNPLVIKRFAQMRLSRVKSDRADADLIRCYGERQPLSPWAPATGEVLELQQAHGWLDDLIGERTRLVNRQEAHAHHAKPSAFVIGQNMLDAKHSSLRGPQSRGNPASTVIARPPRPWQSRGFKPWSIELDSR